MNQFYYNVCTAFHVTITAAFHVTITYAGLRFQSIPARSRPGIWDSQPDPLGRIPHPIRSRPGLDAFSLVLRPITAGFREALDEIGPMTRNPERDTERSRVVRARSPSLARSVLRFRFPVRIRISGPR